MKNQALKLSIFLSFFYMFIISTHSAYGQNVVTIGSGMKVLSGNMHVSIGSGEFVNNGSYTDTTGTFNLLGGVIVSGTGVTTLNNLNINHLSGLTILNSLVSVQNTSNLINGNLNANNNLFLRSDYSPLANKIVTGVLTGDIQGLVTRAYVSVGPCPSYTSNLSLNISGPAMRYQWQSSLDAVSWTNVAGATNETYSAEVLTDIYYRCNLSTSNSAYAQATPATQLLLTGVPGPVSVTGEGAHCVQTTIFATGGTGGAIYYQGSISGGVSTAIQADTANISLSGTYFFRSRSTAGCWGKQDSAIVVINPLVTPLVTLENTGGLHLCDGNITYFETVTENGGSSPTYQWYVNNVATGASGNNFSFLPSDGDIVKVLLTSSVPCPTNPTDSATATMKVDSNYIPVVDIRVDPSSTLGQGQPVTLTAVVKDAGPTPNFQWLKNGVIISGATNAVYSSSTFADKDSVTCLVIGSGICAWPSFNSIVLDINSVTVKDVVSIGNIGIMPNPNNGKFAIKGILIDTKLNFVTLDVTNMLGQKVYSNEVKIESGVVNSIVELPNVARGSYLLTMTAGGHKSAFHIVVSH